ncbi:MAG: type II secretion system protein M [Gammaproteobacteria bacterium]|nr:type II secretion system protein M [Gammaproteobacteria bacterium]
MIIFSQLKQNVLDWFNGLEAREQRMLTIGVPIALVIFIYLIIIDPLITGISDLRAQTTKLKQDIAWMQRAASQVQQLNSEAQYRNRSLMSSVDQQLTQQQLKPALQKIEADGENGARIWLNNVPFDQMVRALGVLKQQDHIVVKSAFIKPLPEPGRVEARINLAR